MMQTQEAFLILVRLGLGLKADLSEVLDDQLDWRGLQALAAQQGLSAIVLDGINQLQEKEAALNIQVPKEVMLPWIGEVLKGEAVYQRQLKVAAEMAALFQKNDIRTYVLKGNVVAECYPKPEHRVSVDLDCFLCDEGPAQNVEESLRENLDEDVWEKGNRLIEEKGMVVERDYYKNSTFFLPGLMVENHKFLTPFRGNKRLKELEGYLQSQMKEKKVQKVEGVQRVQGDQRVQRVQGVQSNSRFEGTCLYRPPVMVSALFLIEHAYSHFLHEGLTWRHVLDWMMFSRKHEDEIDWTELNEKINEYGFRKFYDSFYRMGLLLLGEPQDGHEGKDFSLSYQDKRMLEDIWARLDLHESVVGWKGKLNLAGNTWRARWKYRYFSPISMLHALWIQTKGVLFDKKPTLKNEK